MQSNLRFHPGYFVLAALIFVVEVCIALWFNDKFVRPILGDFLVVMLIYASLRTIWAVPVLPTAIGVLLFAFLVEFLQYIKLIEILGWQDSTIAQLIMGTSFQWTDMLAYTLGILVTLGLEKWRQSW